MELVLAEKNYESKNVFCPQYITQEPNLQKKENLNYRYEANHIR